LRRTRIWARSTWSLRTKALRWTRVRGDFGYAVKDFYLSNPIARASSLMAELSANAKLRGAEKIAAE
jgi:hypothetical protein